MQPKKAIVTGGSTGIGVAICRALLDQGFEVSRDPRLRGGGRQGRGLIFRSRSCHGEVFLLGRSRLAWSDNLTLSDILMHRHPRRLQRLSLAESAAAR